VTGNDVIATVAAIESGLARVGYKFEKGSGIVAAQRGLA